MEWFLQIAMAMQYIHSKKVGLSTPKRSSSATEA